jgi:hypothetical protein
MNKSFFKYIVISLLAFSQFACSTKEMKQKLPHNQANFSPNNFLIKENNSAKKVKGQILYLPVYSNIPYRENNRLYDLSAFAAIHNTDFNYPLRISKVLFFGNDGKLVSNFLSKDTILQPLEAINFFVPDKDKSGTGANFIIEWISDSLINEPLIESVMIGLKSGQGISFLSTGKILRELK